MFVDYDIGADFFPAKLGKINYNFSKEELAQQVSKVLEHSQSYMPRTNTKPLIDQWFKAKQSFINSLNGELIYQYPDLITFYL